ncbi:hypothetical protein ScPMuIL_007016 [Solemya velum]
MFRLAILFFSVGLVHLNTASPVSRCVQKADVYFILDVSSSILETDFNAMKTFVIRVLDDFNIGENDVRIGLMTYSNTPRIDFNLGAHLHEPGLRVATAVLDASRSGFTQTHLALELLRKQAFSSANGGRDDAIDVAFILTDGRSTHRDLTVQEAERNKEVGIHSFAIGVTDVLDVGELMAIENPIHNRTHTPDDVRLLINSSEIDICQLFQSSILSTTESTGESPIVTNTPSEQSTPLVPSTTLTPSMTEAPTMTTPPTSQAPTTMTTLPASRSPSTTKPPPTSQAPTTITTLPASLSPSTDAPTITTPPTSQAPTTITTLPASRAPSTTKPPPTSQAPTTITTLPASRAPSTTKPPPTSQAPTTRTTLPASLAPSTTKPPPTSQAPTTRTTLPASRPPSTTKPLSTTQAPTPSVTSQARSSSQSTSGALPTTQRTSPTATVVSGAHSCTQCDGHGCTPNMTATTCAGADGFCMNTVQDFFNGTRVVHKMCTNQQECTHKWLQNTFMNADCSNLLYYPDLPSGSDLLCHFCCVGDNCNAPNIPDKTKLYNYSG